MPKREILQLERNSGFEGCRRAGGEHVKHAERKTEELMKDAQALCSHSVRYLRYPQSKLQHFLAGQLARCCGIE